MEEMGLNGDNMWGLFRFFESVPTSNRHLVSCYKKLVEEKEAIRLAEENTLKFIYYCRQGSSYFHSAARSELLVRPLLLYYGMTSLMKALIITHDPYYPKTTAILQHGVTTRKRKKTDYSFLDDEVKIQKEGLIPHFATTVGKEILKTHRKFKVIDLLQLLPELQEYLKLRLESESMLPVQLKQRGKQWACQVQPLASAHIQGAVQRENIIFSVIIPLFLQTAKYGEEVTHVDEEAHSFSFTAGNPSYSPERHHPQFLGDAAGNCFFYCLGPVPLSNEIINYNMVAYLLSMLCRYDTELWGELLFSFRSNDLYIIEKFMLLSIRRFPQLILKHLFDTSDLIQPN